MPGGTALNSSLTISRFSRGCHNKLQCLNSAICGKSALEVLFSPLRDIPIRDACLKPLVPSGVREGTIVRGGNRVARVPPHRPGWARSPQYYAQHIANCTPSGPREEGLGKERSGAVRNRWYGFFRPPPGCLSSPRRRTNGIKSRACRWDFGYDDCLTIANVQNVEQRASPGVQARFGGPTWRPTP